MSYQFERIDVHVSHSVATVRLQFPDTSTIDPQQHHRELASALWTLRGDDDVRVVVVRGAAENVFYNPYGAPRAEGASAPPRRGVLSDPSNAFAAVRENDQILMTLLRMEKPVVAMVNGDALGLGASLVMACDLVVAAEDAFITDIHMGGSDFVPHADGSRGIVPGDGGIVLWPLHMGLAKAKEFLLLSKPVRARELADLHAINYAVPRTELQDKVDELVEQLLARPAWALGWSKSLINKMPRIAAETVLDAAIAYESMSMRVRDEPVQVATEQEG